MNEPCRHLGRRRIVLARYARSTICAWRGLVSACGRAGRVDDHGGQRRAGHDRLAACRRISDEIMEAHRDLLPIDQCKRESCLFDAATDSMRR